MPLPTDDLIIWASSDVNLPNLAGPNKVKPIDDLILKGWDFKQKPAADEFNYVLNNLGMHVSYLEESKTYTFTGDLVGTATSIGSDNVTFDVSVVNNSHNHISANISDATSANSGLMIVKRDASGNFSAGTVTAEISGNASTASKWQTARNLAFTGFATGNSNVDGSGNVSIALSMGTGFTSSKVQNGYAYRPDGLIEQWGWVAAGEDTVTSVTLPITYPNAILNLSCTARSSNSGSSGTTDLAAHGDVVSTSSIVVIITSSSGAYTGSNGVFWRAIGY